MTNPQQNALAEALEPCPFCQSVSVSMSFSAVMTDPDPACRFVECEECSAMGPVVHIEVDDGYAQSQAIVAWNRRASNNPTAVEGQGELAAAAKAVIDNASRSYRSRGKDRYIEDSSGECMMLVPHEDWHNLGSALAALAPAPGQWQPIGRHRAGSASSRNRERQPHD